MMKLYYIKRKADMFNDKFLCDKILDIIGVVISAIGFTLLGALLTFCFVGGL